MNILHATVQKVGSVQHDVTTDLKEKFEGLFPTWTTVVATILALLIILIVLVKLVYKPVKKMHDDRRNYIQNNIDSAEAQNAEAVSDRELANDELINARLKATEIINKAKLESEDVRAERIAQAEKDARKIIEDAQINIKAQQAKFDEESREAIVEVALAAAAKVVEKEVDNDTNKKIIEDFVKAKK